MIKLCILANNRLDLFKKCLESVIRLRELDAINLLLFIQKGNKQVEKFAFENSEIFNLVTYIAKRSDVAAENIEFNRKIAYQVAFDSDECELVIFLEEDVEVAKDLIEFSIKINDLYKSNRNFNGINYGSVLKHDSLNTYSLLRYGMHGPASAISRHAWEKYLKTRHRTSSFIHFDGMIEHVLKTGFMVTPNRSLYFDNGKNGSHTGKNDIGFMKELKESFRIDVKNRKSGYELLHMAANWRYPAPRYKRHLNLFYKLIFKMISRPQTRKAGAKIEKMINTNWYI